MKTPQDFIAWALDPKRTLEEAFFAEVLVDQGVQHWEHKQKIYRPGNWEAQQERGRARRLNPAHRAQLSRPDLDKAAEVLREMSRFSYSAGWDSDRPLRNLSGLQFLPGLHHLDLSNGEAPDLSPLVHVPDLVDLSINDKLAEDFRPIARCRKLKSIHLYLYQPWPILDGWEDLPELESLRFNGNLLAVESIPRLPAVNTLHLNAGIGSSVPLRDLRRLPEMPRLRVLELEGVHRLDGIERYPELRILTLGGTFCDLTPLTALKEVTHLTLKGDLTRDLKPLVRMPALRKLTVQSHHPQDYLVLSDAPMLHEVEARFCDINRRELATLHALLPSWSDEFAAPAPRPLPPLRFRIYEHDKFWKSGPCAADHPTPWDDNVSMKESEGQWMARCLNARISKALKHPNWGETRHGWVNVHSLEAADHLAKIIQVIREFLATTRFPQRVSLRVDLKAQWHRDDEKDPELKSALHRQRLIQEEVDEHLEWERKRREEQEYLARLHELRQLEAEGAEVKAEQFAPPPPEVEEAEEEEEEDQGDDIDDGDVLERVEKEEDDGLIDPDEPHPLSDELDCWFLLSESEISASDQDRAAAIYHLHREPDKEV